MEKSGERLETDKLTEEFTLRIPEVTMSEIKSLSKHFKRLLNERLLVTIAEVIHQSKFDPRRYLIEKYNEVDGDGR